MTFAQRGQGKLRVIGLGNILLSDEGIGVHLAAELEKRGTLPGTEFVDGGVAGGALLELIEGRERVIILDAVAAPFPPGTVVKLAPDDVGSGERLRCSPHDLDLSDALSLLRLRGTLPAVTILGVVPADVETCRIGLSDPLSERFEEILAKVEAEIRRVIGTI